MLPATLRAVSQMSEMESELRPWDKGYERYTIKGQSRGPKKFASKFPFTMCHKSNNWQLVFQYFSAGQVWHVTLIHTNTRWIRTCFSKGARACAVDKNLHACVTVALMTVRWNTDMYLLEVEMSYLQLYWVSPWCIWYVCIVLPITMGVVGCMLPGYYGCHFYDT